MITVAAGTALLAACGGSDAGNDALPPGAPGSTSAATPSATASPGAAVLSSYLGFWDAVVAANKAADPGAPDLAAVAADPELSRVRAAVSRNKIQMLSLRGEVGHTPKQAAVSGTTATLEDCYDISGWNPVSLSTGKPVEAIDVSGTGRYRARYTLRRSGAGWLVEGATSGCTHTYTRASARYDGNVTRNWVVHYEQGGNPIDIPGAPVTLVADTPWALAVAEAQVLTGTGGR